MNYKKDYPILGFGCMRLPSKYSESEKLILKAYEAGITYYDTAYIYMGNEELLGKIFENNNLRDKIKIASKLPIYLVKKSEDFDKYFYETLKRLRTTYIDNYLMHMLPDVSTWNRLVDLGLLDWLKQKKESGEIKHIGFSYHGSSETFMDLLDVYPWEFCQVQYNYIDEHTQAGRAGVQKAYELDIPVIIMEPLRGGSLTVGLCDKAKKVVEKTGKTAAWWGLSWLYNQKEVTCVLSGMTNMDVLVENIDTASNLHEFSEEDYGIIKSIREAIESDKHIGCTGCKYCMPCPFGVDIPGSFACYNASYSDGFIKGQMDYLRAMTMKKEQTLASQCKKCGKCEKHCPQAIPIRKELGKVRRRLESPLFKVIKFVMNRFYK